MTETSQDEQKETGRVEAFSDGVFAIAITLLILDVRVPKAPDDPAAAFNLFAALLRLWPALLAYFMSFAIILVMWVNHHRIFAIVRRIDQPFLFWNGLLLMLVTFVPFPTALLSEYMRYGNARDFQIAAIVYAAHGLLISLAFVGLWRYGTAPRRGFVPAQFAGEVARMWAQYRWGPVSYLAALGAAFVWPWGGVGICLALALVFSFRGFAGKR